MVDYSQFDTGDYKPTDPGTMTKVPAVEAPKGPSITEQRMRLEQERQKQVEEPLIANLQSRQQQYETLASQRTPIPRDPKFTEPAPAPKLDFTDPIRALQNPGVIIATLGSFFSRAPMTAAMNAGGAAMEAYHKGEAEVFAEKHKEWKENLEVALEKNKIALQKLNNEWKKSDAAVSDRLAKMQAIAAGEKMDTLLAGIRGADFERIDGILGALQKANDTSDMENQKFEHQKELVRLKTEQQEKMQQQKQKGAEKVAKIRVGGGGGEGGTGLSDQAKTDAAWRYIKTGVLPSGMGNQAAAQRREIMNMASEQAKQAGIDMAEQPKEWQKFKASQVAIQRFESGPQGNTIRSLNVTVSHLSTLRMLSEALHNGDVPRFNAIAQMWAKETGHSAPTNFDAAKRVVGTEISKALATTSTGEERKEFAEAFARANTPEQMVGVIQDVMQPLLGGQLKGLRNQFVVSTQLPAEEFNRMLEPETVQFLGSGGRGPAKFSKDKQDWMSRAREKNPGSSDEELSKYYDENKGGK